MNNATTWKATILTAFLVGGPLGAAVLFALHGKDELAKLLVIGVIGALGPHLLPKAPDPIKTAGPLLALLIGGSLLFGGCAHMTPTETKLASDELACVGAGAVDTLPAAENDLIDGAERWAQTGVAPDKQAAAHEVEGLGVAYGANVVRCAIAHLLGDLAGANVATVDERGAYLVASHHHRHKRLRPEHRPYLEALQRAIDGAR